MLKEDFFAFLNFPSDDGVFYDENCAIIYLRIWTGDAKYGVRRLFLLKTSYVELRRTVGVIFELYNFDAHVVPTEVSISYRLETEKKNIL